MSRPQPIRRSPSPPLNAMALLTLLALVVGCEPTPEPPQPPATDPVLAGLLADAGEEGRDLPCPGATEAERRADFHPKLLRGEAVRSTAGRSGEEEALGEATIAIRRLDDRYEPTGEALLSTTSDGQGRYCVRLPDEVDFGPDLAVVATAGELRLRRLALDVDSGRVTPQSEALVEVLAEAGVSPANSSYEELINLHTLAATAVDLMTADGTQSEKEAIAADPRVRALLEEMSR